MTYDEATRGTYQYREYAKQLIRFDGMTYGKITPTDIDGLIEYQDKAFVLYECKFAGAEVPYGQKLALIRMTDDFQNAGKDAMLLICEHNVRGEDIMLADASVRGIYYKGKYHRPHTSMTAKEATDRFLAYVDKKSRPLERTAKNGSQKPF